MKTRRGKATEIFLGIATFLMLWGALNLRTSRAFWPGDTSKHAYEEHVGMGFVTRESHPKQFWAVVGFKLTAGSMLLILLGNAHWQRWRRLAAQKTPNE